MPAEPGGDPQYAALFRGADWWRPDEDAAADLFDQGASVVAEQGAAQRYGARGAIGVPAHMVARLGAVV